MSSGVKHGGSPGVQMSAPTALDVNKDADESVPSYVSVRYWDPLSGLPEPGPLRPYVQSIVDSSRLVLDPRVQARFLVVRRAFRYLERRADRRRQSNRCRRDAGIDGHRIGRLNQ